MIIPVSYMAVPLCKCGSTATMTLYKGRVYKLKYGYGRASSLDRWVIECDSDNLHQGRRAQSYLSAEESIEIWENAP